MEDRPRWIAPVWPVRTPPVRTVSKDRASAGALSPFSVRPHLEVGAR